MEDPPSYHYDSLTTKCDHTNVFHTTHQGSSAEEVLFWLLSEPCQQTSVILISPIEKISLHTSVFYSALQESNIPSYLNIEGIQNLVGRWVGAKDE